MIPQNTDGKTYVFPVTTSDNVLMRNESDGNTLQDTIDILKSATKTVTTKPLTIASQSFYADQDLNFKNFTRCGNIVHVTWSFKCNSLPSTWTPIITGLPRCVGNVLSTANNIWSSISVGVLMSNNGKSISLIGGEANKTDYWLDFTYFTDEEG